MPDANEIGNQLKSQSLDEVLPSAFKQVGGRVFPDALALTPLLDLIRIVDAYRATHTPSYGNVIQNSGEAYAVTLAGDGLTGIVDPTSTEVIKINSISVTNGGGAAPIVLNLQVGDSLLANVTCAPLETVSVSQLVAGLNGLILSKGQSLAAIKVSGTATDMSINVSAVKCSI